MYQWKNRQTRIMVSPSWRKLLNSEGTLFLRSKRPWNFRNVQMFKIDAWICHQVSHVCTCTKTFCEHSHILQMNHLLFVKFCVISYIVSSSGVLIYSEVKTFLKTQSDVIINYNSITTSLNETLIVTGNHLIYARRCFNDKFNPM